MSHNQRRGCTAEGPAEPGEGLWSVFCMCQAPALGSSVTPFQRCGKSSTERESNLPSVTQYTMGRDFRFFWYYRPGLSIVGLPDTVLPPAPIFPSELTHF